MEGAVQSGNTAAQALLDQGGHATPVPHAMYRRPGAPGRSGLPPRRLEWAAR